MNSAPRMMVSSTFYDLKQLRADLARFINDELGYEALLSELPSFPVNPDLDTVENCRARVEQDADIFVLVIGGRYGSIDERTNTSITNLEYLSARKKGIPIYAFVEKAVLTLIPVWKRNPAADFSSAVDTPRLFEFLEQVRGQERVWTFPFETAQDVIGVLRQQIAYLVHDALHLRQRASSVGLPEYYKRLSPESLRIALERPKAWEYRLFLQSWIDQIAQRRMQIKEYRSGVTLALAETVSTESASSWLQTRLHELLGFVGSANKLVTVYADESFGPPGEPGSVEDIIWVSSMLGNVLDNLLDWAKRIRCARLEEPLEGLGSQLALFVDDMVTQFESLPVEGLRRAIETFEQPSTGEQRLLELTMVFKISNLEGFEREMEVSLPRLQR